MINKLIYLTASFIAILGLISIGTNGNYDVVFAQGDTVAVSIVPGSATLTENGYSPDPVEVTIGQPVVWTNDDTAFHTITSGLPGDPDVGALFDSGIEGPTVLDTEGKTFEHTFDTAGEFDYHCALHPVLVGKVIVT